MSYNMRQNLSDCLSDSDNDRTETEIDLTNNNDRTDIDVTGDNNTSSNELDDTLAHMEDLLSQCNVTMECCQNSQMDSRITLAAARALMHQQQETIQESQRLLRNIKTRDEAVFQLITLLLGIIAIFYAFLMAYYPLVIGMSAPVSPPIIAICITLGLGMLLLSLYNHLNQTHPLDNKRSVENPRRNGQGLFDATAQEAAPITQHSLVVSPF